MVKGLGLGLGLLGVRVMVKGLGLGFVTMFCPL